MPLKKDSGNTSSSRKKNQLKEISQIIMRLIDHHAHLTSEQYHGSLDEINYRAGKAGVEKIITVGTDLQDSLESLEIAQKYENVFFTAGFHPHEAKSADDQSLEQIRLLLREDKAAALGEIGLDYYYEFSSKEQQKNAFAKQLEIAVQENMPVVIHSRDAFENTAEILSKYSEKLPGIVIHCFGEGPEQAEYCLKQGWYVSFTGVVTFKNAERTRQAAAVVPPEKLLAETDCPYMSPAPLRKYKTNEPSFIVHIAEKLAEVKGLEVNQMCEILWQNAESVFRI
ncbi:putative deoxyribonuclease YcfH [Sedimentisphaera cyanobacteriorum]|uniref:Putative deoxyribonuclease YcfH n=1 Tax=Sedimentisphaera cyanobacteriorum TaxID=1940790 RepID=A0A1Q2HNB5_9BACT|nr:TatD family hydrolase [Sedimentisphaera cyanobacteriorum]AQQ08850.1 putative deoxyribonuclease YcfH [Sedimentisphaera cyanobacteriorum]